MPNCISTWPSPNFVTLQAQLFSHFCLKNFEERVEWKALLSFFILPKRSRKCFLTFSPIHFYCQSVNPHIFQGHVRQDSGVCRLRLRQILLFRSTEYVSCFLLLKKRFKIGYSIKLPWTKICIFACPLGANANFGSMKLQQYEKSQAKKNDLLLKGNNQW